MSHFSFLDKEWPGIHEAAVKAERHARSDAQTSCFYARRSLELLVDWLYSADASLTRPYRDDLNAKIHEPSFRRLASDGLFTKANLVRKLGNKAVHDKRPMGPQDGVSATRELFHLCYWMARTYARKELPDSKLQFDPAGLPTPSAGTSPEVVQQTRELIARYKERGEVLVESERRLAAQASEMEIIKSELEQLRGKIEERKAIESQEAEKLQLREELERLRAEIAAAKAANVARPDAHDYNEQETRDAYIDLLLGESGWKFDHNVTREHPVTGMPNDSGKGLVDYVLWGDDGKPLGLVEAKRTRLDPTKGKHQAKLYADALEKAYGQRPVIFLSNGYQHFIWDDLAYPPREVHGFYNRDQLELLIQRRTSQKPLDNVPINAAIVERPYQHRAIRRVAETFERDRQRRALLVMATGSGKTRTTIALIDLLMRCNWVRRVLFLADRKELVTQAGNEMAKHLPDVPPGESLDREEHRGSGLRQHLSDHDESDIRQRSTFAERGRERGRATVLGRLFRSDRDRRSASFRLPEVPRDLRLLRFLASGPDRHAQRGDRPQHLQLVPARDGRAHRRLHPGRGSERRIPRTPPRAVSVSLRFPRQGIRYEELSEDEKERWEELDWEGGQAPSEVAGAAINNWFFNADTVDKVLGYLMTHGIKVAGGDRLGKTIIFAKNAEHARFIAQRFDASFPHYKGHFAQVITYEVDYAESLISKFKKPEESPHVAISVDMLDTGVDVPEVVNLVFFKLVRSKTKFWQMVGRGTRLCPDLFGPGRHKQYFNIFDFCQNLEYFSQNLQVSEPPITDSLGARLFKARLKLLTSLPATAGSVRESPEEESPASVRLSLLAELQGAVGSMNTNNIVVRPHRKTVEKFTETSAWDDLRSDERAELETLATLPTELESEPEESKRFDLVILRLQLALLNGDNRFASYRQQVRSIANALLEKTAIPMVKEQEPTLQRLQSDEWWQDVTIPMLEGARKKVRALVGFVEKTRRTPIYTDFADTLGPETEIELADLTQDTFARFRQKTRAYLRQNLNHLAVHKLHTNQQLTPTDLEELQRMLSAAGVGAPEQLQEAAERSQGLGLFARGLVGLDRQAASDALSGFIAGKTLSANQLHFLDHIVDHLTRNGVLDVGRLYEAPFTDRAPQGPEALWGDEEVDKLVAILDEIKVRAVA